MNSFIIQILTVLHICVTQISTVDATTCDIFFGILSMIIGDYLGSVMSQDKQPY